MPKEPLSLFHEHFLLFLQEELQRKKSQEGWDEKIDLDLSSYRDLLSQMIRGQEPLRLEEILGRHKQLFEERGPVHLELKLLEAFPELEMKRLGLPPLRMYRGLPRLYCQNGPALSCRIDPAFSHLPSLKKVALAKPLYALYAPVEVSKSAKVALLAQSDADAWLASRIAHLFQGSFGLDVHLFSEKLEAYSGFDLLLQIGSDEDLGSSEQLLRAGSKARLNSGRHHLGLHLLERGIFILPPDLEGTPLLSPTLLEMEASRKTRRLFLARLTSPSGVFVYLHALLKSLEWDTREIDICVPDARAFVDYFAGRLQENLPLLEKSYGVGKLFFAFDGKAACQEFQPQGKTLRISSLNLSDGEMGRLMTLSDDFTAISDERGFSEAVSANKGFFFEPSAQSFSLLKDLIALAENRLAAHRSTLNLLRLFWRVYEHPLRLQEGKWVDEFSIQCEEKEPLLEVAEKIGLYLQDPDALAGFKKLNRLIAKEHSCNAFLLQMVQRAVCHRLHPEIAGYEEEAVSKFILNQMPIAHLVEHLRDAFISKYMDFSAIR